MSIDIKPKIQLRMVQKTTEINQSMAQIKSESQEKKKGRRGRPRKNPIEIEEIQPNIENIKQLQPKKRGRKKKLDNIYSIYSDLSKDQTISPPSFTTRNYIVQLKVKSSDLDLIQKQYINKTQQVGYKPLISQKPTAVILSTHSTHSADSTDLDEKIKEINFDEYYQLLNNLETPLIPVADLNQLKMDMICGETLKNNLPEIPNRYQSLVMPLLPENIPIKLFNESETDNQLLESFEQKSNQDFCKTYRNTTNLILPQFNNAGGKWPEKSPYACWNCDIFFDGTPIGIPDKEHEGEFYCYGNFCRFECAARYLADRESTIDFWAKYSLLCIIYQKASNLPPGTKVPIAPPKESLTKYGGKYSYEEYHSLCKQKIVVEIYKLPLIPVLLHIEEVSKSTNINNIILKNTMNQNQSKLQPKTTKLNRFIPIDPHKLSKAEENLKLKTQERLQSNYTLDDCFKNK
jgi:hypothetical protein